MSITDSERGLIARYAARLLVRNDLSMRALSQLSIWLHQNGDILNLPISPAINEMLTNHYMGGTRFTQIESEFHRHRPEIVTALDLVASETPRPEPLATNVEWLVAALGLPRAAWKVLGLFVCAARFPQVSQLVYQSCDYITPFSRAIALLVGDEPRVVEDLISPEGSLVGSGLLALRGGNDGGGHPFGRYHVPLRINACLDQVYPSFAEMRSVLLGEPLTTSITLEDYEHVAADRDLLIGVLKGAAGEGAGGINVLLYGPPGSGKTELAKLAAATAGLTFYATGEEEPYEGEPDRAARIADLVFSQRLIASDGRVALLFDEMEDAAVHLYRRGGSKVFFNRILERNKVPVIWTSNAIDGVDPALLRRMTLAIELKRPPVTQRRKILTRLAERVGVALPEPEIDRLSRRLDATPAIYENALRAARLAGGGADEVERAAMGIMRAVSGVAARRPQSIPDFDPALAVASQDLTELADRLVDGEKRAFSLCMSGPPGTGKSAFARHLSRRLGIEIIQKRASDIFGPYVGQTERQIALAFEEAREAGAMLIFDEADSLLMDRRDAVRSWEISQVNEMLTWMEEHPLPVCFTTNLMDRIDQASLRRFTFHVAFRYLDREALKRAWQVFFAIDKPPVDGLVYANLTPGDFAKARKQADVLGILDKPQKLADIMGEISRGKPDARGTLGFVV